MIKVSIIFSVALFTGVSLGQTAGPGACGVELAVNVAGGGPIVSATAELIDVSGKTIQTTSVTNGKGTFCDFGFGYYSIRVHGGPNMPVTLQGVRLHYGFTQRFYVTLNHGVGDLSVGGNRCRAYIRTTALDGIPLGEVKATYGDQTQEADQYGRLLLLLPPGQFTDFRLEKPGFKPQNITLSCSDIAETIEREVRLSPMKSQ